MRAFVILFYLERPVAIAAIEQYNILMHKRGAKFDFS